MKYEFEFSKRADRILIFALVSRVAIKKKSFRRVQYFKSFVLVVAGGSQQHWLPRIDVEFRMTTPAYGNLKIIAI